MPQDEDSYEFTEIDETIIEAYREAGKLDDEYEVDVKDAINDFVSSLPQDEDQDYTEEMWDGCREALREMEEYSNDAMQDEVTDNIERILTDLHMDAWRPARDKDEPYVSDNNDLYFDESEINPLNVGDKDSSGREDIGEEDKPWENPEVNGVGTVSNGKDSRGEERTEDTGTPWDNSDIDSLI